MSDQLHEVNESEWTVERLVNLVGWHPEGLDFTDAVQEINAELAAQESKHASIMFEEVTKVKQQLAAETEARKVAWRRVITLEQQLADERDENWRNAYDNLLIDYQQLREQLEDETEIVSKVWSALGVTTFEQAKGKAIWELVLDLKQQLAAAQALLREVRGWHCDKESPEYNECDTAPCQWCDDFLKGGSTTALDAAIAEAVDKERSRWNEVFEAEVVKETERVVAEAQQPLVELLEQVLQETVDARDYPDGPCLNADTRTEIKILLAKVKEGKS